MAKLSVLEMHRLLDQEIQSMGFFLYQGFETEEIDLQINTQIDNFVEAVIDKSRGKIPRIGIKEGFQEDESRLDDLRTIHKKEQVVTLGAEGVNRVSFIIPTDYSHHIKTKVVWSISCVDSNKKTTTQTGESQLRISDTQNIENARSHPFYKTSKESPLAELANDKIYIYLDDFTITNAYIDYIKKPVVVKFGKDINGDYDIGTSVDCDLPHTTHRTIIRMTAIHICSIIESNPQKIQNLQQEIVN